MNGATLAAKLLEDDLWEAMRRRGFFGRLGAGLLGAFAAPHLPLAQLAQAAPAASATVGMTGAWTAAMAQALKHTKERFEHVHGPEGWAAKEAGFREVFMYPDSRVQATWGPLLNSPLTSGSPPLDIKQQDLLKQYVPPQPRQPAGQQAGQRQFQQRQQPGQPQLPEPRPQPRRKAAQVYTSRQRSQDRRGMDRPGIPRQDQPRFGETRSQRITLNAVGLATSLLS